VRAIESFAAADKQGVVRLDKTLLGNDDIVTRTLASATLAKLVEPLRAAGSAPPPPVAAAPASSAASSAAPGAPQVDLAKLSSAHTDAMKAAADAKDASDKLDATAKELEAIVGAPAKDDAAVKHAGELAGKLDEELKAFAAAKVALDTAAAGAKKLPGDATGADAKMLLDEITTAVSTATAALAASQDHVDKLKQKTKDFTSSETGDPGAYLAAAEAEIATGRLGDARADLDRAAEGMAKSGKSMPMLDFAYAELYEKEATAAGDDKAAKLKLLHKAKDAYDSFAQSGSGSRVKQAQIRSEEIGDDIKDLEAK
jgi:hypothetical protein